MLYVGYGSNIPSNEMFSRCHSAKYVGKGYIKDYELKFNFHADIDYKKGSKVPCVVYEITSKYDIENLDFYEGYPHYYDRHNVDVILDNGENLECVVYEMTPKAKQPSSPTHEYFYRILKGYKEYELDENVLKTALKNVGGFHKSSRNNYAELEVI